MQTTSNFFGIYWVMAEVPLWAIYIGLWFFCIGILYPGRKLFEGRAYNVAFSSDFGDIALIGIFIIGAWVLQANGKVPKFANSLFYQAICFIAALIIGIVCQFLYLDFLGKKGRPFMIMDSYHNLVAIPLLAYLIFPINIPVMLISGNLLQWLLGVAMATVWTILVFIDLRTGRLDQKTWLALHRPTKKPWKLPA